MFTVIVKKKAQKEIQHLSARDQERVYNALLIIADNPFVGKRLDADYQGLWSYRVWPYRILYAIHQHAVTVLILRVGHRKDVYR